MKNFLKSTAIFACIALLVCACETDDTETGVGAAPEGVFFLPGANRAMVSWTVPEDSDVEGYSVTWKDSNGNSSKTSLIKVAGSTEPAVTQLSEIPVGTLSATLTPMSGSGGSTTLTTTVYDASTYEEKIPVVYDVDFDSTSLSAEIEWGSIDMDCLEIEVSYTDIYGEEVSTGRAPIDDNMILSNIQAGDSITYVAYFCPAGGLDEVRQYVTTSLDTAPYAPTDVSVSPGVNRIVATWVLDFTESDDEEDEDSEDTEDSSSSSNGRPGMSHQELVDSLKAEITGTIIRCVNTRTAEVTVATVTMDEHTDSLNNYEVTLVPGDYEVSVFTMKESGATSSVLDATATVTVYSDLDYLKTDSFQASIASTEYLTSTAQSSIYWDYAPTNSAFLGVEVTYVGFTIIATPVYTDVTDDDGNVTSELTSYEYSASTTETSVQTTACTAITGDSATATYIVQYTEDGSEFYNAIAHKKFTYASCFCPEGGLDTIRIYSYETPTASANTDSFVFVEADPLAATSVELTRGFTTGEDGVEAPYITATCSIEDVTDISNYVLEVAVDGVIDESYTTVYEASELEIDADLAVYLLTYTIEDAKIGSSYEVSLTSVTSSFTQSKTTSEAITTYNTETYSVLEPSVSANCNDAVTVTVLWNSDDSELYDDISNIAVLYGNQSNDYSISQLRSGISLTLLAQDLVNTLYYTVTYTPANAEVSVTTAQVPVPVKVNPTAPSSIVTTRGYNTSTDVAYIDAAVEITEIKDIAKYVVDLSVDGVVTENYLEFNKDIDSYLTKGISFRVDSVTVGAEYIVSIYAVDVYDSESTVTSSDALVAYNSTTYTASVYAVNSYDNVVIAKWSNVSQDMTDAVVNYGSMTYSDFTYSELTNFVQLEDTTVPESFSYTMTFCPSSGTVPVSLIQTVKVVTLEIVYDIVLNDEGVYEIYTGAGLEAFAAIVNGSVYSNDALVQSGDIVFVSEDDEEPVAVAGANAIMMANVSLSGVCNATNDVSWTPIGDSSYTGTFDGNGMIVSGLYINTSGEVNRGLFGIVTGATIKNLKLSNVDVTFGGTASPISGSLVGLANGASYIYGCEVSSGSVNITSSAAGYCGGVIGRIGAGTTVENCINRASIKSVMQQVGGVVGNVNASYAYIKGCINYGTMNVANYAGGIVGYFWQTGANYTSEITDCHNYGEINSTSTITGGIAGSTRCASGAFNIEGCTNSGTITTSGQYIGGLIGYAIDASVTTITNCTNYGAVTSEAGNVGGILGWENVATGTLTITECNNYGALQGTSNIGGIMGTSKAIVSIVGPGYNYGSITATTSNGGGIIGTNAGTVSNYVNKGLVTIAGSPSNGTDANGIYGTNSGTVTNCVDEY